MSYFIHLHTCTCSCTPVFASTCKLLYCLLSLYWCGSCRFDDVRCASPLPVKMLQDMKKMFEIQFKARHEVESALLALVKDLVRRPTLACSPLAYPFIQPTTASYPIPQHPFSSYTGLFIHPTPSYRTLLRPTLECSAILW